jgi:hypothetical protein
VQTAVPRPPSTEKLVHERVGLKSPAILLPGRLGALFSRRRRIFLAWTTSAKVRVRSGASALSVGARQMRYTYGRTPYLWSSDDGWRSRDEQECWGIAARHLPESTPRRCRLGVLPAMVPVFHPVCARSEPANAITRDRETDTRCLKISVVERGQTLTHCALRESSAVLLESGLDREIELQIESAS